MATKIATMRTLKPHPNMLQLHAVFEDEEGFHVVLEFCKGAALLEQIHNRVRRMQGVRQGSSGSGQEPSVLWCARTQVSCCPAVVLLFEDAEVPLSGQGSSA